VPQRRLAAVPLALVATAALAAGCSIEISPESVPVPFSVAPTPSASAGVPKYVCSEAYKILTDGAVRLAGFIRGDGEHNRQGLRDTLTDMAGKMDTEPALRLISGRNLNIRVECIERSFSWPAAFRAARLAHRRLDRGGFHHGRHAGRHQRASRPLRSKNEKSGGAARTRLARQRAPDPHSVAGRAPRSAPAGARAHRDSFAFL